MFMKGKVIQNLADNCTQSCTKTLFQQFVKSSLLGAPETIFIKEMKEKFRVWLKKMDTLLSEKNLFHYKTLFEKIFRIKTSKSSLPDGISSQISSCNFESTSYPLRWNNLHNICYSQKCGSPKISHFQIVHIY